MAKQEWHPRALVEPAGSTRYETVRRTPSSPGSSRAPVGCERHTVPEHLVPVLPSERAIATSGSRADTLVRPWWQPSALRAFRCSARRLPALRQLHARNAVCVLDLEQAVANRRIDEHDAVRERRVVVRDPRCVLGRRTRSAGSSRAPFSFAVFDLSSTVSDSGIGILERALIGRRSHCVVPRSSTRANGIACIDSLHVTRHLSLLVAH